jgi:alpha-glucoside transport system substrate-binding protein
MIVVGIVLAVLAAACSSSGADTSTTESAVATTATSDEATTTEPDVTSTGGGDSDPYPHLARAIDGEFSGTSVLMLSPWIAAEGENFATTVQPFIEASGIDVTIDTASQYDTVLATRIDGGNPPDIASAASPGYVRQLAAEGQLVSLSEWFNIEQLAEDYIPSFIDLSTYEDNVYGVFIKADLKSVVWYPVEAFADAGYEVPETWDDLVALSDQIVADGNGSPWCLGIEDGEFSGWAATDWIEDTVLRTAPAETYDQWVNHEIPFDAPEIVNAVDTVGSIWFTPDYVLGGSTGINAIAVVDAVTPMFAEGGPDCWLHKQAAWITEFFPEGVQAGVDASFFFFPPIDEEYGRPVLGSGDQMVMFNDRPEVRALMEYFATADGARGWVEAGGFLSPNNSIPLDWYSEYPTDELAAILQSADVFRFDGSDIMPAEVGGGTFWTGTVDWVAQDGEGTEQILSDIEASWPTDG